MSSPSTTFREFAVDTRAKALPVWFEPVLRALVVEVFVLIALGGFVRIMNAGLACPDWPLCFGDYIPDYHPQVYLEFIHRAMAGVISITTGALLVTALLRRTPPGVKPLLIAATLLLSAQVVFGGVTVLWQLHAGVVAAHLGLGTAFFGLLLWLLLSVRAERESARVAGWLPKVVGGVTLSLYGQLLLGGLVASNYAGKICSDFPKCNGEWFPTFQGPIGLQVIHRLGAYVMFTLVLLNWRLVRHGTDSARVRRLAGLMFLGVGAQVGLGIANVRFGTPPVIGVAHLATATFLLSLGLRPVYWARSARATV